MKENGIENTFSGDYVVETLQTGGEVRLLSVEDVVKSLQRG